MPQAQVCRRSCSCWGLFLCSAFVLNACSQPADPILPRDSQSTEKRNEIAYFDVALFSYQDRPIFDVYLNGRDIGLAAGQPHRGEANGLMTGIAVPPSPQVITWRLGGPEGMPGNGNTVTAINQPVLSQPDAKLRYLGVHIYPDNTVEVIPEAFWPKKTDKGVEINRLWEITHGK